MTTNNTVNWDEAVKEISDTIKYLAEKYNYSFQVTTSEKQDAKVPYLVTIDFDRLSQSIK